MIWVTKAKYDGDYRVLMEFNDGRTDIVDLSDTILNGQRHCNGGSSMSAACSFSERMCSSQ